MHYSFSRTLFQHLYDPESERKAVCTYICCSFKVAAYGEARLFVSSIVFNNVFYAHNLCIEEPVLPAFVSVVGCSLLC